MSLVKRPNSRFWYVQFQINHVTVVRSTRTTDRRIAEKVALRVRADAHAEIVLGRRNPMTLEHALDRFVGSRAGTPNHPNLVSHRNTLLTLMRGSLPLSAITSSILEDYCRRRAADGVLPQTIKHGLNCLMGALRKAKKDGYQCPDIQCPSIKIANKMVRYLSVEEESRLLIALEPTRDCKGLSSASFRSADRLGWMQDNYDLVVMLLDTGARYGEIANIGWKQIDLPNRSIRLWRSKVQNESIVFMTDRVVGIVHRRLAQSQGPFVFSNKQGGARGYSATAIRKALRRAGLADCTIHTLRHTHATRLIQNGLNVYEVKAVLGHTDIKTTMRYAHLEQTAVTMRARDVINKLTIDRNSDDR